MKKNLLILLGSLFTITRLFGQQATVNVKFLSSTDKKVTVTAPFNGERFEGNTADQQLDTGYRVTLNFTVNKIGYVRLINSNSVFKFYIGPGTSDIILDVLKKGADRVQFTGPDAEGQKMLNKKAPTFYQYAANSFYKKDSTITGFTKLVEEAKVKDMAPYDKLLSEKMISPVFYAFEKNNIEYYYEAVMNHIPIVTYNDAIREGSKITFRKDIEKMWNQRYANFPPQDLNAFNADYFYAEMMDYIGFYKVHYLAKMNGTYQEPKPSEPNSYLSRNYMMIDKTFKGKMRETMLANNIYNELIQEKYQLEIWVLYQKFALDFPNSQYKPLLKPLVKKIVDFQAASHKEFTPVQRFITNYQNINSLDELLLNFKGKTVFVDIWATWCGPCKAEFEFREDLDKFAKEKGIELLYISMDRESAGEQWKTMIKYYDLGGSHIRTNDALQKDLINKLWGGKGYAIPRYLIIKDGKIINNDALRPSDKDKLFSQIRIVAESTN